MMPESKEFNVSTKMSADEIAVPVTPDRSSVNSSPDTSIGSATAPSDTSTPLRVNEKSSMVTPSASTVVKLTALVNRTVTVLTRLFRKAGSTSSNVALGEVVLVVQVIAAGSVTFPASSTTGDPISVSSNFNS